MKLKKRFKKLCAAVLAAGMIFTGVGLGAGAYDYTDYQKEYAELGYAAEEYTDAQIVLELAFHITDQFPDYWTAKDPYQAAWDAAGIYANASDAFFTAYMNALVKIQTDAGAKDLRVPTYKDRTKADLIERQVDITVGLTVLEESEIRKSAFLAALGDNTTFIDDMVAILINLTDEYSSFVVASDYYAGQDGASIGLGVTVHNLGSTFLIEAVNEGSGADLAGIVPGDVVIAVDGKTFDTSDPENQPGTFGEPGTTVDVTVLHMDSTIEVIPVTRIQAPKGKVSARRAAKDTLVISFTSFELMSDAYRFEKFYDYAVASPDIKKLVIDLRGNVGGDSEVLDAMLSVLTEKGTHLYDMVSKSTTESIISEGKYKGAGVKFDGELFVLTDWNAAFAVDIVTGTIKNIGGTQVGAPTYGKGIAQNGVLLHGGYMAWITGVYLEMPNFGRYHNTPLTPDVPVELYAPAFPDGVLPLEDVTTAITADSDPERIMAYQQRLMAAGTDIFTPTGVLDERTVWFTNALMWLAGYEPNVTIETGIPAECIALVVENYEALGGYEEAVIFAEGDAAMDYVLGFDVDTKTAA